MINEKPARKDDVATRYRPAEIAATSSCVSYWILVLLSFGLPHANAPDNNAIFLFHTAFLVLGVAYFGLGIAQRLWLIPGAERTRRRNFLSDSFRSKLTDDQTVGYYNNDFDAGLIRMGANTMENAFFSEAIARQMLLCERLKAVTCAATWLALLAYRFSSFETVSWITQVVFSAEVLESWLTLELFRHRCERVYERLHEFFRGKFSKRSNENNSTILDAFADYECAKASMGTLLSSRIFQRLNPKLTTKWENIRQNLGMN